MPRPLGFPTDGGIGARISFVEPIQVKEDELGQYKQQVVKAQAEHQGALEQSQIWQVRPVARYAW